MEQYKWTVDVKQYWELKLWPKNANWCCINKLCISQHLRDATQIFQSWNEIFFIPSLEYLTLPNKGLSGRPSMTNLDFKIQFLWFKVTGRIIKTLKSNVFFSFIRIKLIFQIEIQMQDGWRHQFYSSYPDSEIFFRIFYIHRALSLRNVNFKQWS